MRIALVGPELEENLGLRYLHAGLLQARHHARIFDFHEPGQIPDTVAAILEYRPAVVGLSMVFTGRAREYVRLVEELRCRGFRGHVAAGGHFASFHANQLLSIPTAFDSVVHGEGEETLADLVGHLDNPEAVAGISWRDDAGQIHQNAARPNPDDLDQRPWPSRPKVFHDYLGLPIANLLSGRGCFGNCAFCSIQAWYRQNPGRRFRQRRVEEVAREMGELYHRHGVRIFNFHDDNFFLPHPEANFERLGALKRAIDNLGIGRIALQVKARPDSVVPAVFEQLRALGLFRVFLGVESNAVAGLKSLGRGIRREQNNAALQHLLNLGVHVSFNLLMFEPEATIEDLRDNIAFIRRFAGVPLNFGRAEVYSGTPLEARLRSQGRLLGDLFGYHYRIADDRAQLAFEIFHRVFLPRNFQDDGMNLGAMKLDYLFHLLRHFRPDKTRGDLEPRTQGLIRELNENSADLLDAVCDFAENLPSENEVERFAARLDASRASIDLKLQHRQQELIREIRSLAREAASSARRCRTRVASVAAAAALAASLAYAQEAQKPETPPANQPAVAPAAGSKPASQQTEEQKRGEQKQKDQSYVLATFEQSYQSELKPIWTKYKLGRYFSTWVTLTIEAGGKVKAVKLGMENFKKPKLEKELNKLVLGWKFPEVKLTGDFQVEFWVERLPDTHMCEYMMRPMEPLKPKNTDQK